MKLPTGQYRIPKEYLPALDNAEHRGSHILKANAQKPNIPLPMEVCWLAEAIEKIEGGSKPVYFCHIGTTKWTFTLSPHMAHRFTSRESCEAAIKVADEKYYSFKAIQHSFER